MDSESTSSEEDKPIDIIFEAQIEQSSEEDPKEEWSSLEIKDVEHNPKKLLYEDGLYDPGSGELCAAYIAQSASSVLRHAYYKYPAIKDPGILDALQKPEPPIIYPEDGQELYLAICEEMNECPVRCFHRQLLESEINLQYYGINPPGVRAMARALEQNTYVKRFNLTDNFLNSDACYHLGVMLSNNYTLEELNLNGCRIGQAGLQMLLVSMSRNKVLNTLKLRGNEFGDAGMEHLAEAIFKGLNVKSINLGRNNITGKGVDALSEALETHNRFTHWDFSWNNLFTPGTYSFLCNLADSAEHLVKINLSWNGLTGNRVAQGINRVLRVPTLKHLNLSNNKLEGEAIVTILSGLPKAKKLVSFNLSYNPMSMNDALLVLNKLKLRSVNVRRVYMDNVNVSPKFLKSLENIVAEKPDLVVTYGYVLNNYKINGPDPRDVVLKRVSYLCNRSKANKVDIALVALQLQKDKFTIMLEKDLVNELHRRFRAPLDEDLIHALVRSFPGENRGKGLTINIDLFVEYIKRKWPDSALPPTPPPEEEIVVEHPKKLAKKTKKK